MNKYISIKFSLIDITIFIIIIIVIFITQGIQIENNIEIN